MSQEIMVALVEHYNNNKVYIKISRETWDKSSHGEFCVLDG